MKISLLTSLQKSTPKTYITCLHLNLQKQLQIQLKFRGLSAKVHLMNFKKKVQMMKRLSPCNSLCKTTQKSYMIWAICKLNQSPEINKNNRGFICKMTKLQIEKGSDAKMSITTAISSSNYPKLIYGMSLFEKLVKIRFEFEIQIQIDLIQKRKD